MDFYQIVSKAQAQRTWTATEVEFSYLNPQNISDPLYKVSQPSKNLVTIENSKVRLKVSEMPESMCLFIENLEL